MLSSEDGAVKWATKLSTTSEFVGCSEVFDALVKARHFMGSLITKQELEPKLLVQIAIGSVLACEAAFLMFNGRAVRFPQLCSKSENEIKYQSR
jgi:hypothetical protein